MMLFKCMFQNIDRHAHIHRLLANIHRLALGDRYISYIPGGAFITLL